MLGNAPNRRVNQLLPPLGFRANLAAFAAGIRQRFYHCA